MGVVPTVDTDSNELTVPPGGGISDAGFNATVGPFPTVGETVAVILTFPPKPPRLDMVRLDDVEVPLAITMLEGLELTAKSGGEGGFTVRKICTQCESLPLAPVTFAE